MTLERTSFLVAVDKYCIGNCRYTEAVYLFGSFLSQYNMVGTYKNVQNCNFRDYTETFGSLLQLYGGYKVI